MKRNDIIRIAQEAGLHIATDVKWMPIISLEYAERFAALVLANNPPQRAWIYDWHDYEVIEATEAKLKEKNT
jgi:hypothetical protein